MGDSEISSVSSVAPSKLFDDTSLKATPTPSRRIRFANLSDESESPPYRSPFFLKKEEPCPSSESSRQESPSFLESGDVKDPKFAYDESPKERASKGVTKASKFEEPLQFIVIDCESPKVEAQDPQNSKGAGNATTAKDHPEGTAAAEIKDNDIRVEPSGLDIRVEPSEADLRVEPSEAELSLTTAEERATSTLPTKAATYAERKTDEEIEMDVEDVEDVLNKNPEDIEQAISSTGAETNSELACLDPFKQGAALSVDDELTIVHEPNAIIVDDDDKEDERLEEPLVFSGQSSEEENISKTESQPLDSFASTEIHEQVTKVPFQSLDNITPHNQPDIVETVCLTQDALTTQLDDSLRGGDVTSEDVLPTFKQGLQRGSEDASVKAGVQPTEDIVVIQDDAEKGDGENQPSEVQDQIESHATKDDLFDIVDSGDGEDQITVTENLDSKGTTEREEPMLHEQIDSDSEDLVTKPPLGHDTSPETFELQLHDSDSEDNAFVIKTRQSDSLTESSSDLRRETTEPSTSGILETEVPEDVISLVNLRRSPRGSHKDNPVTPEENKATEPSTSGSLETETPEDAISVVNLRRSPRRSHREKSVPVEDATETEDAPPPLNVRQSPRISAKDKSIIVEECLENVISDHALQTLNLRRSPRKHTRDKQIAEEDKITETPNVKPVIVKEPTTTDPYGVSVTDVNAEATDSQTTTDSEATAQEDTLPTFSQRKKRSTRRSSRHMSKITNQATVGPLKVPPSVTRMSASVVKRNSQSAKSVKESKAVDEMPTTLSDLRQKSTDFQALKSHEDLQSEDVLPAFGLRTRSVPRQSLSKIQNSPVVKISPLNYKTKSSDQQKSSKNSEEDESSVLIESESEKEQEVATSTQKPSPSRRSPSRRHRVSSPTKSPSKTSPSKNRRKSYHYPSMRDLTPTSSPLTRSASKKLKKEAKQVETVRSLDMSFSESPLSFVSPVSTSLESPRAKRRASRLPLTPEFSPSHSMTLRTRLRKQPVSSLARQ